MLANLRRYNSPGYRDWKMIAVDQLIIGNAVDQLRAQLGNEIAIKAYKDGKLPSRMAQSLPRCIGNVSRPRTTIKS